MSDSYRPRGLQHSRLPCPSLSPRVCPNSCPLSQWCYLTISSSVAPFFYCLQFFQVSGSFPTCRLFTSGGASAWVLPMNTEHWFPSGLTGLSSLQMSTWRLKETSSTELLSRNGRAEYWFFLVFWVSNKIILELPQSRLFPSFKTWPWAHSRGTKWPHSYLHHCCAILRESTSFPVSLSLFF